MDSNYFTSAKISTHIEMTPEGFLICRDVPITRAGEIEYEDGTLNVEPSGNGVTILNKPRYILQDESTISSFEGKPITLEHPVTGDVTPENYREVTVGSLRNVRAGTGDMSDYLISDMLINDKESIAKVLSGEIREVSIGGISGLKTLSKGVGEQTWLYGNHAALVENGRAGPSCAIQDSKKGEQMSIKDRIKSIFATAEQESFKLLDSAIEKEVIEEKDTESVAELKSSLSKLEEANAGLAKSFDELKALMLEKDSKKEEEPAKVEPEAEPEVEADAETISRAEILAPGISRFGDVKSSALKAFYSTDEGKAIIDPMLAGKVLDSVDKNIVFVTASEIVKANRRSEFSGSSSFKDSDSNSKKVRTPAEMNEKHKEFWKGVR